MPSASQGELPGGGRLPLPSRPPGGPTGPQAPARSPLAPRFSADRPLRLRRPHTPGPGRPRPVRSARLPGRGSAGRTRADGSAGGKFPPRKEEGRGGAGGGGGEGKGRRRKGRGGGARPPRETAGRRVPGARPQATNNNNNNNAEDVLPRCPAKG